jgi:nicotinic acid phosphoribosyltransferase
MNPSDQATAYGILYTDQYQLTMAQILETPLLNHPNYQTLIATKAAPKQELIAAAR